MYDLCNRLYVDAIIQPGRLMNEHKALVSMVKRSRMKENAIIIADRNYESYNDFAHIEQKGFKYLIRIKDRESSGYSPGLVCQPMMSLILTSAAFLPESKQNKSKPARIYTDI